MQLKHLIDQLFWWIYYKNYLSRIFLKNDEQIKDGLMLMEIFYPSRIKNLH